MPVQLFTSESKHVFLTYYFTLKINACVVVCDVTLQGFPQDLCDAAWVSIQFTHHQW